LLRADEQHGRGTSELIPRRWVLTTAFSVGFTLSQLNRHELLSIPSGRLVRLSEHSLRVSRSHYVVHPVSSEANPALVAFRDWLIEEARRT
jgi:DNA-binding transcriptional LysR family regulator